MHMLYSHCLCVCVCVQALLFILGLIANCLLQGGGADGGLLEA